MTASRTTQTAASAESFLVLHGIGNHRPPEHWEFWLSAQLAAAGHQVLYPGLPDPDAPRFEAWALNVEGQLAQMRHSRRTVIWHSLSCLLWLALAGKVPHGRRPSRVLLVSPPDPAHVPAPGRRFIRPFSPAAVAVAVDEELRVVCSDNDPYNPAGAAATYAEALGCPADVLGGAGHITPDTGYGAWPAIESWCLGRARRVSANPPA